eukprot:953018_1
MSAGFSLGNGALLSSDSEDEDFDPTQASGSESDAEATCSKVIKRSKPKLSSGFRRGGKLKKRKTKKASVGASVISDNDISESEEEIVHLADEIEKDEEIEPQESSESNEPTPPSKSDEMDDIWAELNQTSSKKSTVNDSQPIQSDSQPIQSDSQPTQDDSQSNLGDSQSNMGDSQSNMGDSQSNMGDSQLNIGDSQSNLGDSQSNLGDSQSNLGDSQSIQGDSQSIQKPKKREKRVALNWWEQEAPQPKRRAIAKSMQKTALVEVEQKTEFAGETLVIKKKVEKGSAADLKFQKKRRTASRLDDVLFKLGKKDSISTLTKSKFDWEKDKDEKDDSEQLEKHVKSKNSFVERQKFLARTQDRLIDAKREAKRRIIRQVP